MNFLFLLFFISNSTQIFPIIHQPSEISSSSAFSELNDVRHAIVFPENLICSPLKAAGRKGKYSAWLQGAVNTRWNIYASNSLFLSIYRFASHPSWSVYNRSACGNFKHYVSVSKEKRWKEVGEVKKCILRLGFERLVGNWEPRVGPKETSVVHPIFFYLCNSNGCNFLGL